MIVRNMIKCKKCGDLTPPTPYGVGFRVTIPHFSGKVRKRVPYDQSKPTTGSASTPVLVAAITTTRELALR